MKFNPEQLLTEITELMSEADAEAAKGGRLHKAGGNAHTTTKADHHEKMAELCAKMADSHASIADHYKTGAKGAYKSAKKADDGAAAGDEADVEETTKEDAKKATGYGALDSIRSRPSRAREGVTRHELNETLAEFGENFAAALIKIFAPPSEKEPTGDELAAVRLLQSQGYVVHSQPTDVRKGATLDAAAVADRGKVETAETPTDLAKIDEEIRILKAKIVAGETTMHTDPSAQAATAEARVRLDILAKAAIKLAIRQPRVAVSGQLAGMRGNPLANQ